MGGFREQVGEILHHSAIRLANTDSRTLIGVYMAPAFLGLAMARSKPFGMTEDFATWLAVASFVYMSMPALWFLGWNLAVRGTRFRVQVLLIVLAIIAISVGLAFGLADLVPMPSDRPVAH